MIHALQQDGFAPECQVAQTEAEYLAHLTPEIEIILADYTLPAFDALGALQILQARQLDIPFIVVTGAISEEIAVACMRQGATDYLLKDRLMRLGEAVRQALQASRLRAEKRRTDEQVRFQSRLLEAVRQAVVAIQIDGHILYWNQAAEHLFGWTAAEIHQPDVPVVQHMYVPLKQIMNCLPTTPQNSSGQSVELVLPHRNGTDVPVLATVSPLYNEASDLIGCIVTITDITDRKHFELSLKNTNRQLTELAEQLVESRDILMGLFDGLDDGLMLLDPQGVILAVNQTLADLLGTQPAMLLHRNWRDVHARSNPLLPAPWIMDTLHDARERRGREQYHQGNQVRTLDIQTLSLAGVPPRGPHVIVHIKDVTEQLHLENLLIQKEQFAASGKVAAIVAHEISTPLQSIQSCLFLADDQNPGQNNPYLQLAREEIIRISGILEQVLSLYRSGSDLTVEQGPVSINLLLERVLLMTESARTHHDIRVDLALSPDIPPLYGSSGEMTQVFLNLIVNAIDAMPGGGVLKIRTYTRNTARLVIEIGDTGVGISANAQARIFDPFFTTKPQGTGLGLAVVQQIVARHSGTITVYSTAGKGSTFKLTF